MRVLLFGGGGFIGSRLARQIAREPRLGARPIDELVLIDQRTVAPPESTACRVSVVHADMRDEQVLDGLFAVRVDAVFHFAASLMLDAETDFARGLQTNVLALVGLLERCRAHPAAPLLLFASSISTFGGTLPGVVGDDVFQAPTTSYGTQKVLAEQLLADYSRHGFLDGRALRLPVVLTHPGPATGSVADQVASLIREPLRGQRTTCRMAPDSRLAVASVDNVVRSFIHLGGLPQGALQGVRTMNLPALTVTPAQIVHAVERRLPDDGAARVAWEHDAKLQEIIDGWPSGFTSARALALGVKADESIDAVVDAFLAAEEAGA